MPVEKQVVQLQAAYEQFIGVRHITKDTNTGSRIFSSSLSLAMMPISNKIDGF